MTIYEFQKSIAEKLSADGWLKSRGVEVVAEDSKDVLNEVAAAIAGVGICVIVATPELSYIGDSDEGWPVFEISRLELQIAESVGVNRARQDCCTALAVAQHCAALRDFSREGILPVSISEGEASGNLLVTAAFSTAIQLTIN